MDYDQADVDENGFVDPSLQPIPKPTLPVPSDPKGEFIRCFKYKKTIAGAVNMSGTSRDTYNEWMKDDSNFARQFTQVEEAIDDAALEIAYRETGLLPKTGGHRKLKIDRALLREILKRHPRFKPLEEKKVSTDARPIEIKGIDPRILLRVTGQGMEIGINPEPPPLNIIESPAIQAIPYTPPIPVVDALPPKPEVKVSQPFVPSFTPEQIAEMKANKSARFKAMQQKWPGKKIDQPSPEGNA